MDEREYHRRAEDAMAAIEAHLEAADADFEFAAGSVLQVEREDGSKIIINKQAAAHEIWVAARSGGFHYRWDGDAWRDTRSGEELLAAVSRLLG